MIAGRFPLSLFIFLLQITALHSSFTSLPSNASSPDSNLTHILQDVLKAISASQKWDLKDVRVSKLDVGKVRFGTSQSYEFRIGLGNKNNFSLEFSDQVASWNKFRTPQSDLGSLIHQVSSLAVLDTFKLEGPFELRVDALHHLSLSLPNFFPRKKKNKGSTSLANDVSESDILLDISITCESDSVMQMNISYTGLKHILVCEGITLEVRRAQQISLFHSSDLDLQMAGGTMFSKGKSEFWPFLQSTCMPLIPIRILGSASLVAYRAGNPDVYIKTTFISEDTVELLPEKCYHDHMYRKRACPIDSLSLRLSMLEKSLKSLIDRKILQNQFFGFLKANIKSSAAVRFPLELERDIGSNVTLSDKLPEWRTRPSVERIWFEILARVEANRLKPLLIKKVKLFIDSDSVSWANLMSNMSFTKLRPVLLPPEALTLDVKW